MDTLSEEGVLKLGPSGSEMLGAGMERLPGRDSEPVMLRRSTVAEFTDTEGNAVNEPIVDCTLTSESEGAEIEYVGAKLATLVLTCVTPSATLTARFFSSTAACVPLLELPLDAGYPL